MKVFVLLAVMLVAVCAVAQQPPTSSYPITLTDSIVAADTVADAVRLDTAWSDVFDFAYQAWAPRPATWKVFFPGVIVLAEDSAWTAAYYYVALITGIREASGTYYWLDTTDIDTFTAAEYSECTRRFRLDSLGTFCPQVGRFRIIRVDTNEAAIPDLINQAYTATLKFYPKVTEY